jgi:hypothetical protein
MSSTPAAVPHAQPVRSTGLPNSGARSSFRVLSRPTPAIDTRDLHQRIDPGREKNLNGPLIQPSGFDMPKLHGGDLVTSPSSDQLQNAASFGVLSPTGSQRSSGVPGLSDSRGTTIDSVSHTPISAHGQDLRALDTALGLNYKREPVDVEEDESGDENDESTGSQTPRRRGSGPFGFGFSLTRRPSDKVGKSNQCCRFEVIRECKAAHMGTISSSDTPRPVDATALHVTNNHKLGTPRRPSLLTQQILSSPAVPLATNTTAASSGRGDVSLSKRPSLKDRVKGSLLGSVSASREFASALATGEGHQQVSGTSTSLEARRGTSRVRKGSSGTYMSSRPSFDTDDHLEELVEDGQSRGSRGRPGHAARRKTYNAGSSQDDMRSNYTYGTSASGWDRSMTGLTTDDDEGV